MIKEYQPPMIYRPVVREPTGYNAMDEDKEPNPQYYGPKQDTLAWQCNCGSHGFYVTTESTYCWDCHTEQKF